MEKVVEHEEIAKDLVGNQITVGISTKEHARIRIVHGLTNANTAMPPIME